MIPTTASLSPHIHTDVTARRLMLDVIIALAPAGVASLFIFGWRAGMLIAVCVLSAMLFEAVIQKIFKKPIAVGDCSAAVTGLLIAYNLPASAPWWLGVLGSAFAIIVVKQCFGGLGHNFLNPAITARAFLLASWPALMTSYPAPLSADAITGPTPLAIMHMGVEGTHPPLWDLFIGNVPGSLGEVSRIALLAGGIYLLVRGVIDWRIPLTFFAGMALIALMAGLDPLRTILSGGTILGGFFMLTDYVTSPLTRIGRLIYGLGAAIIIMLIRMYSKAFPEGVTYAVMFMNILTPLIDRYTPSKIFGEVRKHA